MSVSEAVSCQNITINHILIELQDSTKIPEYSFKTIKIVKKVFQEKLGVSNFHHISLYFGKFIILKGNLTLFSFVDEGQQKLIDVCLVILHKRELQFLYYL